MIDDNKSKMDVDDGRSQGFVASLLKGLIRDAIKLIIAFAIGTGVGAIVCWYYGIPLVFSLIGGLLVLGLALAISTDSLFS